MTMDSIVDVLSYNDGVIVDPQQDDGEGWFDYAETITEETIKEKGGHGVKEGDQIYWRVYLPLPTTVQSRLSAVEEDAALQAGLSLWELDKLAHCYCTICSRFCCQSRGYQPYGIVMSGLRASSSH